MVVHSPELNQLMAAQDVDSPFMLLNKWSARVEFGTNVASTVQIVGNHWIRQILTMVQMEISTAGIATAGTTDQRVSVMV